MLTEEKLLLYDFVSLVNCWLGNILSEWCGSYERCEFIMSVKKMKNFFFFWISYFYFTFFEKKLINFPLQLQRAIINQKKKRMRKKNSFMSIANSRGKGNRKSSKENNEREQDDSIESYKSITNYCTTNLRNNSRTKSK